jgi:hypothetical protein
MTLLLPADESLHQTRRGTLEVEPVTATPVHRGTAA